VRCGRRHRRVPAARVLPADLSQIKIKIYGSQAAFMRGPARHMLKQIDVAALHGMRHNRTVVEYF